MAWIYFGNGAGLDPTPVQIPAFNQWSGADFAWTASSVGDFDGDGRDDFALALRNDERADQLDGSLFDVGDDCPGRLNDQGGVYIFAGGSRGNIGQQPAFVYWGPRSGLWFDSINAAGDVNGDGKTDLLVGAIRSDINARDAGSIFVVTGRERSADGRTQVICAAEFEFSGRVEGGEPRSCSGALGDITGDRCGEFAVGAENSNYDGNVREGLVWIFRGAGHSSCPPSFGVYRLLQGDRNARFGSSLAAGQLDDDSVVDLAVGARTRSVEQATRGSVTVYSGAVLKTCLFLRRRCMAKSAPSA